MSKTEIPPIRFHGVDDAWEQHKLGDCFSERVESMPDGELISVTINDGIKKFSELGRHDNSNEDKSKYKKVCVGDIAYNSMRMWQGASGYSPYEGIVSPAYTVLTPNPGIVSKCLAYQFKLPQMTHTFQIHSQGITSDNWNLKYPTLSEIMIFVSPIVKEQEQIARFFTHLDDLITLHQRKYEKLTNVKKSMLEKMFPRNGSYYPEIRFKGFTGPWKRRKLGEITTESTEYATFDAGLPLLTSSRSGLMYQNEFRGNLTTDSKETLFSVVPLGACTYRHMSDDDVFHLNVNTLEKGLVSREYPVFFATADNSLEFLVQHINSNGAFRAFCAEQKKGGTRTRLYYSTLCEFKVMVPELQEQAKIAGFLLAFDNLITLHQRELEQLQNVKKALLEKMFV